MACESTGVNERRLNQFNKIRLLNDIANQLAYYGVQNGHEKLFDYIDLNCGAIPDGEFEQVIDLNAPHEFLSLYMNTAENRFAFAVTELLKMSSQLLNAIKDFCFRVGQDMKIESIPTISDAYKVIDAFVLDGMPCDETKKIEEESENQIIWTKVIDTHEKAWKKAGGDVSVYYELQESFVQGLLEKSGFKYQIEKGERFILQKI